MKKTNIIYWIITILFAALMFMSAVPDLISAQVAAEGFAKMGMPAYMMPFLGLAKILGVIVLFIPGYPRLKEWAYAGLLFDLIGATWCIFNTSPANELVGNMIFMLVMVTLGFLAYAYYQKKMALSKTSDL